MARGNATGSALTRRTGTPELARWSPWNAIADMHREMDDLFSRTFGYTPLSTMLGSQVGAWEPSVDIYETDDKVVAMAALPGFAPESVHVEATADTVTIQGERGSLCTDDKAKAHRQSGLTTECSFSVSYSLPVEIDPNQVKATFKNGVLNIEMNKAEHARPRSVKIDVTNG